MKRLVRVTIRCHPTDEALFEWMYKNVQKYLKTNYEYIAGGVEEDNTPSRHAHIVYQCETKSKDVVKFKQQQLNKIISFFNKNAIEHETNTEFKYALDITVHKNDKVKNEDYFICYNFKTQLIRSIITGWSEQQCTEYGKYYLRTTTYTKDVEKDDRIKWVKYREAPRYIMDDIEQNCSGQFDSNYEVRLLDKGVWFDMTKWQTQKLYKQLHRHYIKNDNTAMKLKIDQYDDASTHHDYYVLVKKLWEMTSKDDVVVSRKMLKEFGITFY